MFKLLLSQPEETTRESKNLAVVLSSIMPVRMSKGKNLLSSLCCHRMDTSAPRRCCVDEQ